MIVAPDFCQLAEITFQVDKNNPLFLKYIKSSQENICVGVSFFLNKVEGKKQTPTQDALCKFCKVLRTPILQESFEQLLPY